MSYFNLDREIARLILLQRNEISSNFLKRIRKVFGRYFFTNFVSRYLISPKKVSFKYYDIMNKEFETLKKYLDFNNKKILSIGPGMCGLELIINSYSKDNFFTIIEKNYVSKKVTYGWDSHNNEAYNKTELLRSFLNNNGMQEKNFEIIDFDNDEFPLKKFDYIISLYSLDYHYDFNLYFEYLKKVSNHGTKIIFDTIRADYFKKIFKNNEIILSDQNTVHLSKRLICSNFI